MMDKRVLVVGSGGREHALAWKLRQSPQVAEVVVTPGNGGTPGALSIAANDLDGIVAAAAGFDLVVVGPEDPLAAGLVDRLTEAGILAFGPVPAAASVPMRLPRLRLTATPFC
jgi:phosphoribosylamine--glycine ligase